MPNTNNYFIVSPAPSPGLVLQGQLFQHANTPAVVRKDSQRKDYTQEMVELESIVLTCEYPVVDNLFLGGNVQRRVQTKHRRPYNAVAVGAETLRPDEYFTTCGKCRAPSENHISCQNCGHLLSMATPAGLTRSHPPKEPHHPALARLPIHPATPAANRPQFFHTFSNPPAMRVSQVDAATKLPARFPRGCLLLSNPAGRAMAGFRASKDKTSRGGKQPVPIDPIVLSSDDEGEEGSAHVASRMDSCSPCPADSAHSSPAPSAGRVEAAMKDSSESEDIISDYFTDTSMRIIIPRKQRMKDPSGNLVADDRSTKRRKEMVVSPVHTCVSSSAVKQDSIILDFRSVRLGTLRRMIVKPVTFSIGSIQIETEAPEEDVLEKVELRTSELTSCEWCSVRKLPTLFLQTTPAECLRLRAQLNMSRNKGGTWYDCKSTDPDEKHIVLIFEKGLSIQEEVLLEEILKEIGKTNSLQGFPTRLPFQEANARLVRYNNNAWEKTALTIIPSNDSNYRCCDHPPRLARPPSPAPQPVAVPATCISTRLHSTMHFCLDNEDEDISELPSTFTGTVEKIMVYPPPPAKGGISVTNEDLCRLNTGEFLNDVIIDFYLKYLVLEKLKKEDSHRIHVFSSFFYKRLNQRERKNESDTSHLPMQKKKHNRVKTWTRHVDLFQKDFIFVPINESSHWFLAVICFPGLDGPRFEPNPLYRDEGNEDGILDMDGLTDSRSTEWALRPTICKQPCILIMDSLSGPVRSTVVKTLGEYLEVEWEVRKGTQRSFGKEVMRGSNPLVPQQDNFSDCGIYVLQYVESFFQNMIPSFHLPMNLMEWFPQQRMRRKREEMKELILQIQSRQQTELQCQGTPLNTDPGFAANRSMGSKTPGGH
ncbi:hypothetical protein AAFF_G00430270 [Aldrovandia affinis]|uniref:Sentrin-specific protease 7 n=1 Tax=Aldrovandia affinis TaxID=143900 RepID=A0AAD7S980_9TELE|nr:hypothetical protein AAFF_G00430270 [Aldrovandia affinis]